LPSFHDASYADMVDDVIDAIGDGVHPKIIHQGSSGSYFVRNTGGKVIGVFKPKDEEPYSDLNPKWIKWIQRMCCYCCPSWYGRYHLLPKQGYLIL